MTIPLCSLTAPLLALPDTVLFPHALLPLQMVEARYRDLTSNTLESRSPIAVSLLRPGWHQCASHACPPVHNIVGLGEIISHNRLTDGRILLILRGLARAKLLSEKAEDAAYRVAKIEICQDWSEPDPVFDREARAEELIQLFLRIFKASTALQLLIESASDLPLRTVCDTLLGSLPLPSAVSQKFLGTLNADTRSGMLLELLYSVHRGNTTLLQRPYPPNFSSN